MTRKESDREAGVEAAAPLFTSAVILAAGRGERFGAPVNKAFLDLCGVTVLEHSLILFATLPFVQEIILVVSGKDRDYVTVELGGRMKDLGVTRIVTGGARRADSSRAGFAACDPGADIVLIHDAARPFPPASAIRAAVEAAAAKGAATLAVPLADTLKRAAADGLVEETLPREGLYRTQTPQAFRREVLAAALDQCGDGDFTDDATPVEEAGFPVVIVPGSEENIKITTPEDLALARALHRAGRNPEKEKGAFGAPPRTVEAGPDSTNDPEGGDSP